MYLDDRPFPIASVVAESAKNPAWTLNDVLKKWVWFQGPFLILLSWWEEQLGRGLAREE